jgi:hypothetical protein
VNVNDFPDVKIPEGDMLEGIFKEQEALMEKYEEIESRRGFITVPKDQQGQLDHRFVQFRIKDLFWRCVEELGEAANAMHNKPWKTSEVPTDEIHVLEETADALHFFIEACITMGMSAQDLAMMYHRKAAVNKFRQESKY